MGLTPFKQKASWDDKDLLTITGAELKLLYKDNLDDVTIEYIRTEIFIRNLDNGTIKVRYETPTGEELSKEQVEEMLKVLGM